MDELMRRQGWGALSADERARLPNFFLIGAMKAGTTSLWYALRAHPDIFMSAEKEPHYFTYVGQPVDPVYPLRPRVLRDYLALFGGVNGQSAVGEASPSYLEVEAVPARIHDTCPDARFIAILRDPADRAFSSYAYRRSQGFEPASSFRDAVQLELAGNPDGPGAQRSHLTGGLYGKNLSRWFDHFDRARVCVLLLEDLVRDPTTTLGAVYAFLGVDPKFDPGSDQVHMPARPVVRSPRLHHLTSGTSRVSGLLDRFVPKSIQRPVWARVERRNVVQLEYPADLRRQIAEYYADDIALLARLIGRDLSAWLEPQPQAPWESARDRP